MTDNGFLISHKNTPEGPTTGMIPLKSTDAAELLVFTDDAGRTLLTFDITEDGVHLEYDPADLPLLNKMADSFRRFRR